ncbi:MAG: BPSS1780 family membrane protein [Wenzhouxiangellaceae bacterium]|nr:BPSS1780 family membrane protein [Wenzhouxiangellaceae bacterium]
MAQSPKIVKARFSEGVAWLTGGGNLLARGGGALVRIALFLVVISLLQAVPVVGLALVALITPLVTAGLLNVFRTVEQGGTPGPAHFLAGFTDPAARTGLLMLGVFFVAGLLAAIAALLAWLAPQMDLQAAGQVLSDPNVVNESPERVLALFEGVNLFGGFALAALIFAIVLAAVYFAVPLVFFWRWPVFAALLWSVRATLVNWLAFLGFGLVVFGLLFAVGLVFGLFSGIFSLALGGAGMLVVQLVSIILSLFVQLLLAAAQWRAFVQVFPADSDDPSGPKDAVAL